MGVIEPPHKVKLFCGIIYLLNDPYHTCRLKLEDLFGPCDFVSPILEFNHSDYYCREFGYNLKRIFVGFSNLIDPCQLPEIKISTNHIEEELKTAAKRTVNIDPGYLDLAKVVLASTKDFAHRIYLDHGIYAEVTLTFRKKSYSPWEWTYPDYKSQPYIDIFNQLRGLYRSHHTMEHNVTRPY